MNKTQWSGSVIVSCNKSETIIAYRPFNRAMTHKKGGEKK